MPATLQPYSRIDAGWWETHFINQALPERDTYQNRMKKIRTFVASLTVLALTACGGGGDSEPSTIAPSMPVVATESSPAPESPPLPEMALDAPSNNLDLAPNINFAAPSKTTFCGYAVPSRFVTGIVTSVLEQQCAPGQCPTARRAA